MNKFEAVLLFSPDLNSANIKKELDSFKADINSRKGKIISEENWGLRDLSYNIKKFKKAFYNYIQIEADGNIIKDLNNKLRQSETLIRFLFVKVEKHQELPTKLNDEKE